MKTKNSPGDQVYFFVSPLNSPNDLNNNEYLKTNFILCGEIIEVQVQYKMTKDGTEIVFEKYKVEMNTEEEIRLGYSNYYPSSLDAFNNLSDTRKRAKEVLESILDSDLNIKNNCQKALESIDDSLNLFK
jgi:hypothetical protein